MSDTQNKSEVQSKVNFTRRNFINPKFWLGVAAGTYVVAKAAEQSLYSAISLNLSNPNESDESIQSVLKISEAAPNSENANFRPMVKIINEGISNFESKTGTNVFYSRDPDYRDKDYYSEQIKVISKFSFLLPDVELKAEELSKSFPPKAWLAYASSNSRISTYEDLFDLSTGFYARIEKEHPEQFDGCGNVKDFTPYFTILRTIGREIIDKATKHIEKSRTLNDGPVSASLVVEYFLTINKGDLGKSIYDTYMYLKFMSRNNQETGYNDTTSQNSKWIINNIKDEYQGPTYTGTKDDPASENMIKLVGKPYHSWNLVAMLQFFPVELTRASGIYRQMITIKDQGLGKTRADLQTLNDLREIEKVLLDHVQD